MGKLDDIFTSFVRNIKLTLNNVKLIVTHFPCIFILYTCSVHFMLKLYCVQVHRQDCFYHNHTWKIEYFIVHQIMVIQQKNVSELSISITNLQFHKFMHHIKTYKY